MKQQTRGTAEILLGGVKASSPPPDLHRSGGPATRIDAALHGGVQSGSMTQAMAPFMGEHALPTGQVINVSMNAPSPHLGFKEWMARGVVGGIGHAAAWPFVLVAKTVEGIALGIVDIFKSLIKWAIILVLAPTLILVGIRMMHQVEKAPTIEGGVQTVVHNGRHAVDGIGRGLTDELPAEKDVPKPEGDPNAKKKR